MPEGAPTGVQAVGRALEVLEALAHADRPVGVGEVAAVTGLPQATAHRLLRTLQGRGYVHHDTERKYSLGAAATRLGDGAQRSLARAAHPYLAALVERCGETANLSVLEGGDVVYLAQVPSPHTLRMFAEVGRHVPAHSTASGKVLLAGLPPERRAVLVARLPLTRLTPRTIIAREDLLATVELTLTRGFGTDEREHDPGIRCVAVPVGRPGEVVAALSLSGPAERFAGAGSDGVVGLLREQAAAFTDELAPVLA